MYLLFFDLLKAYLHFLLCFKANCKRRKKQIKKKIELNGRKQIHIYMVLLSVCNKNVNVIKQITLSFMVLVMRGRVRAREKF